MQVFRKSQILVNLDVITEQTDEVHSIYATTNVVTKHITLQEAAKFTSQVCQPRKV